MIALSMSVWHALKNLQLKRCCQLNVIDAFLRLLLRSKWSACPSPLRLPPWDARSQSGMVRVTARQGRSVLRNQTDVEDRFCQPSRPGKHRQCRRLPRQIGRYSALYDLLLVTKAPCRLSGIGHPSGPASAIRYGRMRCPICQDRMTVSPPLVRTTTEPNS